MDKGVRVATKIWASAAEAIAGTVADGMTIAVGGFGLSGIPTNLITGFISGPLHSFPEIA